MENNSVELTSPTTSEATTVNKAVVVTIYMFISFSGLLFNFLFCVTYAFSKILRASAFFSLAASLAVADSLQLCVCSFYGATSSYLGYNLGGDGTSAVVGAFSNLAWFTGTPTIFMQAINRLIAIRYPTKLSTVYTRKNTLACIAGPWIISIIIMIPNFFPCCYQLWYWEMYSTGYNLPVYGSVVYSYFDVSYTISIIIVVFFIHSVIFYSLLRRKSAVAHSFGKTASIAPAEVRRRQETAQFIQFFVITTLPVITSIVSNLLPTFNVDVTMACVVGMTLSLIYSSANGYIYMFFNQTVRDEFVIRIKLILIGVGVQGPSLKASSSMGTELSAAPASKSHVAAPKKNFVRDEN